MARGSLGFIERHIDKAVLGLAAVALLIMVSLYLIRSPNKIEYGNRMLGPDELSEAILSDAQSLQQAVRAAKPEEADEFSYSKALIERHAGGIFGSTEEAPRIPKRLRLAANFGRPIPDLTEEEEASGDVVLVTPLAPTAPVLRTGRSLVVRQPLTIGAAPPAGPEPPDQVEALTPVEMPWVTAAAYFSRKAQRDAMSKAKYAPYRSKVYVVRTDVERQEVLASGEFSDWQPVDTSRAMPQLDVPAPEFNEQTGTIGNEEEIDRLYDLVKAHQPTLMQPSFYPILAGDQWKMPPLEGHPDVDEDEVAEGPGAESEEGGKGRGGGAAATPRRRVGRGTRETGRRVAVRGTSGDRGRADQEQAEKDFEEACDAYRAGDYERASDLARKVVDKSEKRGHVRLAKEIVASVAAIRSRELRTSLPRREPSDVGSRGGEGAGSEERLTLVTHPEDPELLAVWFHDDSVESGKTYRYRMRVSLWNRYWGKMEALRKPEQAKQTVLVGDWSLPSEPVTVTPSTYLFAGSATPGKDGARVDVYKWLRGDWKEESFTVAVGDVIGGVTQVETGILDKNLNQIREDVDFTTGAVVLDLRFDEPVAVRSAAGKKGEFSLRERETTVLVYLDPADGQVKERYEYVDRNHPLRRRLED